jgi:dTDP-4-dehydrorhamnose 3,5-epimerase
MSALPIPLAADVAAALTYQAYPAAPIIEGVTLRRLAKHRADNGWFMEVVRLTDGRVEGDADAFTVRQLSVSQAAPGRINAFHIHPKRPQAERWTVLSGQLSVWLVDCRATSSTQGVRRRVVLSGEEPALLSIPPGVAHGYKAGAQGALLLYAVSEQFDLQDPNEGRLPWDHWGREPWEEDRG